MKGVMRWSGRLAGGVAGLFLAEKLLNPLLPVDKSFLGLKVVSGGHGDIGWDDFIDVAAILAMAAAGGKAGGALHGLLFRKGK